MNTNDITILFAGDFVPPVSDLSLYSDDLLKELSSKDFSIVNLEAPITYCNRRIIKTGNHLKTNLQAIKYLKDGFFDAVALANNHIRDFGDEGVRDTLKLCNENNIKTVGAGIQAREAGEPLRIQLHGRKIVFLNYCEHEFNIATEKRAGANPFETIEVYNQIKREKKTNDHIFVIYHGGFEHSLLPTKRIVQIFRFLIELGVEGVIGHHTHFYSGVSKFKNKPMAFSLGNFYIKCSAKVDKNYLSTGLLLKISINQKGEVSANFVPIRNDTEKQKIFTPKPDESKDIIKEIEQITEMIGDEELLDRYWDDLLADRENRILSLLMSSTFIEYKLRKHFGYLNRISDFRLKTLLNLFRCETHRLSVIDILERKLAD